MPASEDEKTASRPTTVVDDVETIFIYDGDKIYEPNNYHEQYNGHVTVRYALEHSLNVPTIKIAEAIGYDKVADLAKRCGTERKDQGLSFRGTRRFRSHSHSKWQAPTRSSRTRVSVSNPTH